MNAEGSVVQLTERGWIDGTLSRRLEAIAGLPGRSGPVVCLPDIHVKRGMEAPSSLATAFSNEVIPGLSSCSLNCGMGVVKSNLGASDLTPSAIGTFFRAFRRTARSGAWDLSHDELLDVVCRGFAPVADKYGFTADTVKRIENEGRLGRGLDRTDAELLLRGAAPAFIDRSRVKLGLSLGGNHFVEVQRITRIHDRSLASRWGLSEDQVLVMYHGGGGPVAGFMGRYYGNRTKDDARKRTRLFFRKLKYHFGNAEGWTHIAGRLRYFSPLAFTRHPADSAEGRRLVASIIAGMNYGYAYRLAIASRIACALTESFGGDGRASVVYDVSHNSIQRQTIDGAEVWVHRHNASRVDPDVALPLPGMFNSASYLVAAGSVPDRFLRSAPHGLGELVSRDQQERSAEPLTTTTIRFDGSSDEPTTIPHVRSERVDAALERMDAEGLVRPVVELAPVAVLKGFRG